MSVIHHITEILHLNYLYCLIFTIAIYGLKHNEREFIWYVALIRKIKLYPHLSWLTGIFLIPFFVFFSYKEAPKEFGYSYISEILRSWFFVIAFSNILVDVPAKLVKAFNHFLDKMIIRLTDKKNGEE